MISILKFYLKCVQFFIIWFQHFFKVLNQIVSMIRLLRTTVFLIFCYLLQFFHCTCKYLTGLWSKPTNRSLNGLCVERFLSTVYFVSQYLRYFWLRQCLTCLMWSGLPIHHLPIKAARTENYVLPMLCCLMMTQRKNEIKWSVDQFPKEVKVVTVIFVGDIFVHLISQVKW